MKRILLILMVLFALIACDNGSDGGQTPEGGGAGDTNGFVGQWATEDGKTLIFEAKAANQPGKVTGTLLTAAFEEETIFYYITSTSTIGLIKKDNPNGTDVASIRLVSGKLQLVSGHINDSNEVVLTKQ